MTESPARTSGVHPATGSHVGASICIQGEITGDESLTIAGKVEGSVDLPSEQVVVAPEGQVKANINASMISIQGTVHGDVHGSRRVELRKTATLEGNLTTARVFVEEGAMFRGRVDIVQGVTKSGST